MSRRETEMGAALLAACAAAACGEPAPVGLEVEVRSEVALAAIEVHARQQVDATAARLERFAVAVPLDETGYLAGEPNTLTVRIDDPAPGRWAVHLVGRPASGTGAPATATVCLDLDEPARVDGVVLALLPPHLDADGDTFPEDLDGLVEARLAAGLPLDLSCLPPDHAALLDCNPPPDLTLDPPCHADPGPDAAWNPFVEDSCGDCLDRDCRGGDPPCGDGDG